MGKFEVTMEMGRQADVDWSEHRGSSAESFRFALQAFVDRHNLQPATEPQEVWEEGRLPTEAGWYWFKHDEMPAFAVYVDQHLMAYGRPGFIISARDVPGRWLGPSSPPPVIPRKLERHFLQSPARAHGLMRELWDDKRVWMLMTPEGARARATALNVIKTALTLSATPSSTLRLSDMYIEEIP